MEGLPTPSWIYSVAVVEGRLFAGLREHGVYLFNLDTETWSSAGLGGLSVNALLSYDSILYAGTVENGIYCTSLTVQPHAKTVTTWARMKQGALAKDCPTSISCQFLLRT